MSARLLLVLVLAVLPSCGGVECGEGTFQSGNDCVGFDPNDETAPVVTVTPPGGRSRVAVPSLAVLATDEPAVIFFTTDGSDPTDDSPSEAAPATIADITNGTPIKFVAIDRAGNRSEITAVTYDSDTTAPAPVSGLAIDFATPTDATVTWTNPTDPDYAGTLLARVADVVDTQPEGGHIYAVSDDVSSSLVTLKADTTTQFVDPGLAAGPVRYVAWTYDDLGNYSAPVTVRSEIALGSLDASFTFDTNDDTLTPGASQTPHLDLSTSTATRSGTTVTLTLNATNLTTAYLQTPKFELLNVTNGTFTNSEGTADGRPFRRLGTVAFSPGVTKSATLTFTVTVGQVVTIDLRFAHHTTLLAARTRQNQIAFIDSSTLTELPNPMEITAFGSNNRGRVRQGLMIGEHFVDTPTNHGTIERYDLATGTRVSGVTLTPPDGNQAANANNVHTLVQNINGDLIAVIKSSRHRSSGPVSLIKLDEGLRELARLDLGFIAERGLSRSQLAPDRRLLAIPIGTQIALVDTVAFQLVDADPTTPSLDLLETGLPEGPRQVAFMSQTRVAAIARNTGGVAVIDFTDQGVTLTTVSVGSGRGNSLATGPDGRLWAAFDSGLFVINPANLTGSATSYGVGAYGVTFIGGQMFVARSDRFRVDAADGTANGAIQRAGPNLGFQMFEHWLHTASR